MTNQPTSPFDELQNLLSRTGVSVRELARHVSRLVWDSSGEAEEQLGIEHRDGVDWFEACPTAAQVVDCLLGRHRWQTRQVVDGRVVVERCVCGATGPGVWLKDRGWQQFLVRKFIGAR